MIPYGMRVPVAVWQLCELLYTCYLSLLTYVKIASRVVSYRVCACVIVCSAGERVLSAGSDVPAARLCAARGAHAAAGRHAAAPRQQQRQGTRPTTRAAIRYDTRCYFNVRSKADISQLNLPHGRRVDLCKNVMGGSKLHHGLLVK